MSKRPLNTVLGTLLTAAMLANLPISALSYTGLGEVTEIFRDTVGGGLYYTKLDSVTEEGKPQQSYIFEYDYRRGGTLPLVRYGSTVYGKDRLGSLAATETEDGKTVFAALNGDFYSMQTGVPMGVMIDGGRLISTDDTKYALGFLEDGSAIIGKPSVKMTVTNLTSGGTAKRIDHLNKFPTIWGVYMVTEEFASTTMSATESIELVIELDGELKASGSVEGKIKDIVTDRYNIEIPKGCAVITVSEEWEAYTQFTGFKVGDRIRIDTECAELWDRIVTALGGGDLILDAGIMPDGIIDEDHEKTVNPRTAVGLKPDGGVVFFAVDGRTSASRGLKLEDLSALMAELGCTYAMNLDGGGSTTVMVKPSGSAETEYVNKPSDGNYRSVANGLLFLSEKGSDGKPAALKVSPSMPYILRGSTIDFTAEALDSAYLPTDATFAEGSLITVFAEDYPEDIGSVSDCSFMAGLIGGEYRLRVTNGDISGDVSVFVKDKLDDLTVGPTSTQLKPGSLLELDVKAIADGRGLHSSAGSFYYTLNGTHDVPDPEAYPDAMIICDLGYLDKNGNFQAFGGEYEGEVEIGVWFDEFVRYVNVKVTDESQAISDFEDDTALDGYTVSAPAGEAVLAIASHGYRSEHGLEIGFSYGVEKQGKVMELAVGEPISLSQDAESIKMWIYGYTDGVLSASVEDEGGNVYDLSYRITKDYAKQLGWRELTAEIPESLRGSKLKLTALLTVNNSGDASCSYVIDDVTVFYGREQTPWLAGLSEHWAGDYLNTLYEMGVIQNFDCTEADGLRYYEPDLALTRAEFAKILVLFTGTNAFPYVNEGAALDADTPYDKVPYIRAALASGLMSGRGTGDDGTVVFDPNATITRQEAFKVIGALVDAAATELTFTDSADIADWALEGMTSCVGAGLVSGYDDGSVRPTATITRSELSAVLAKLG